MKGPMIRKFIFTIITLFAPVLAFASGAADPITFSGIPLEFILFGLTLIGVAIFHKYTLRVALVGLSSILILKLGFLNFDLPHHLMEESSILLNLFGLLLGFAILANLFEESKVPKLLPKILPDDWKGPFFLLIFIFVLSAFLDNIAAALIGGSIAFTVFSRKVHIGYLAAIVAASNAGGSGSVLGDTTTTMMWIDGVSPFNVLHAYAAAIPALLFFGVFASFQQHKYHPILKGAYEAPKVNYKNLFVCILILTGAIIANFVLEFPSAGVWAAILIGSFFIKINWGEILKALPGSLFLLSLVLCASMMPVDQLPDATWQTAFSLGFISAVFDNIPLTKLALDQMGYDWGVLAYAVGFGGSMIWFGSSAGVAISTMYPEAKSVSNWVKGGWHVIVGYVIGFTVLMLTFGWHPHAPHKTDGTSENINEAPFADPDE